MYAIARTGFSKVSGISGLLISLAIVSSGNAAFAEGVTEFGDTNRISSDLFGNFSETELEKLEHASTAQATAARLAALGVKTVPVAKNVRAVTGDVSFAAQPDDSDLFPHSARVLPMIVARPQAETYVGRAAIAPRPGLAQPVGVSWSSLRPRTEAERAAR